MSLDETTREMKENQNEALGYFGVRAVGKENLGSRVKSGLWTGSQRRQAGLRKEGALIS